MATALVRVTCLYLGALIVTGRYIVFISNIGQSHSLTSNAFWSMVFCSLLLGFAAAVRFPITRRPKWLRLVVITAGAGFAVLRSSPEGFLIFGVTAHANSWVPPLLGTAAGAMIAAEISR